jgi:hypothetical protein
LTEIEQRLKAIEERIRAMANNLERIRVIEDELLALARAFSNVPEIAELIEKIERLLLEARAAK